METAARRRIWPLVLALPAFLGFYLFYRKYVPLVLPFQLALAPAVFACLLLTVIRLEWGILSFVFLVPLVNNLPYLFGIYEDIPHAPTALVLVLAFVLGWLVRLARGGEPAPRPSLPFFRPLGLFLTIVAASGLITLFRYADFFPIRADGIYEFLVNVKGVRAGGALMSTAFSWLNYWSGPLVFLIVFPRLRSPQFRRRVLLSLSIAASISLAFSLLQKYHSLSLGNTPFFIRFSQINATFKDANSLAAFLACFILLALGLALICRGAFRWFSLFLAAFSLFILPAAGSRSSLAALLFGLALLGLLMITTVKVRAKKKIIYAIVFLLALAIFLSLFFLLESKSTLAQRVSASVSRLSKDASLDGFFNKRIRFWRAAGAMVKDYPLTGVGLGAYIIEMPNQLQKMGFKFRQTDSTQNYLVQVAAELGLVGLLAVLWTIVGILKQLWRSWATCPPEKKFLLAGTLSGLAAFGINFGSNTYIGAFEIKSLLWLLLALALAVGGPYESPAPAKKRGRNIFLLGLAVVICFGGVHLWNSSHSLSIGRRTADLKLSQDFGLDKLEKTEAGFEFRWSGKSAGLAVKIDKPILVLPLLASHPDIRKNPVKVRVYLVKDFFKEKKLVDVITIRESRWETYRYDFSGEKGQDVILLLKVSRTWNPQKTLGAPDPRNLGVAIGRIDLAENLVFDPVEDQFFFLGNSQKGQESGVARRKNKDSQG